MIYYALLQFVYFTNTFSSRVFILSVKKNFHFYLSDFLHLWPPITLRHPPTSNHQHSDPANSWDKSAVILCGSKGRCNPLHIHTNTTRGDLLTNRGLNGPKTGQEWRAVSLRLRRVGESDWKALVSQADLLSGRATCEIPQRLKLALALSLHY